MKYDPPAEAIIQAWALENFGAFSRIHVFPFPHVLPSDGSCSADALSCPVDWQQGQGSDFHPNPSVEGLGFRVLGLGFARMVLRLYGSLLVLLLAWFSACTEATSLIFALRA